MKNEHVLHGLEANDAHPVHCGIREASDTSCVVWALFTRAEAERVTGWVPDTGNVELAERLTGWHSFSRGIGKAFGGDPYTIVSHDRVLVKQHRGLDV